MEHFLPYSKQNITAEDLESVGRALAGEVITRGPQVEAFEQALAHYCGASFAVLFNSGSTALHAACFAERVGPRDRLLTTPNTFIATVIAGMRFGALPIFIDIDPETGNLDLNQLAPNLKVESTRGRSIVIPVHYAGAPVDMKALERSVYDPETVVIEDAAAALGSSYDAEHRVGCCAFSRMTIFSFHPAKILTTGEGGAVTTNDPDLAKRLKLYRNNGITKPAQEELIPGYYEVEEASGNYNFTEFQAALGLSQLQRIDAMIAKRQHLVQAYADQLKDCSLVKCLFNNSSSLIAPQLMVVRIPFSTQLLSRPALMTKLKEAGIGTQVHYIPLYRHPLLRNQMGDLSPYFPGMEQFYAEALTLPLYETLTDSDVKRVSQTLKSLLTS